MLRETEPVKRDKIMYIALIRDKMKTMGNICTITEADMDWSAYEWDQLWQIYLGLISKLNVKKYISPKYNWRQMNQARLVMARGIPFEKIEPFMNYKIDHLIDIAAILKVYPEMDMSVFPSKSEITHKKICQIELDTIEKYGKRRMTYSTSIGSVYYEGVMKAKEKEPEKPWIETVPKKIRKKRTLKKKTKINS